MAEDPNKLDEFVIESLIGEGGMGKVYRARQTMLDRWVALKVLSNAKASHGFIERFYREARSAARLVHPNIIQVYTVGQFQGVPYFTMEYVEGEDLHTILTTKEEPLSTDEVIEVIRAVVKALALAGEHGIVHRDIKPANIMISSKGVVKVMDFGLAKEVDNRLTKSGVLVGTPAYMSPEQGGGQEVDFRSDLYSLGCLFYEMATGHPPFSADNVAGLIYKHSYEEVPTLKSQGIEIHPELEAICLKMLAKKPEERFQSADEVLQLLANIPCNAMAAELSLGRRAGKRHKAMKLQPAIGAKPQPSETVLGLTAPRPLAPKPPSKQIPKGPSTASEPPPPGAAPEMPLPTTQAPPPDKQVLPLPPSPVQAAPAAKAPVAAPKPAGPPRATPSPLAKPPESGLSRLQRIDDRFKKLPDGRWTYNEEIGHCQVAEGLADEVRTASIPTDREAGLGDCLICRNWNKRVGCALAYAQDLPRLNRYTGLKLAVETALAWSGAGRSDKAIEVLDEYLKHHPDEADAYRELARVYDRPDYVGAGKRRAVVLYSRFVELARESNAFSSIEIQRAEDRARALRHTAAAKDAPAGLGPHVLRFDCFYKGGTTTFCHGAMGKEKLLLISAGEMDPETGLLGVNADGSSVLSTGLLKRFTLKTPAPDEPARVKKELARLAALPYESLKLEGARALDLDCAQINGVEMGENAEVKTRRMTIKAEKPVVLLFTEPSSYQADQCWCLLRRMTGCD